VAELPSGTSTFLLTDVEGSTALWEEAPEAMWAALARHDALVGMGDKSEAVVCAAEQMAVWRATPGALDWLRSVSM
jgi:hypothetical protein